jgi:cold shock CspA family protein
MEGQVKKFFADKGYGFIEVEKGEDRYFHITDVERECHDKIIPTAIVSFQAESGTDKPTAKRINVVKEAAIEVGKIVKVVSGDRPYALVAYEDEAKSAIFSISEGDEFQEGMAVTFIPKPDQRGVQALEVKRLQGKDSECCFTGDDNTNKCDGDFGRALGTVVRIKDDVEKPFGLILFNHASEKAIFSLSHEHNILSLGDKVNFEYHRQKETVQAVNIEKLKKLFGTVKENKLVPFNVSDVEDGIALLEEQVKKHNLATGKVISFYMDEQNTPVELDDPYPLHAFSAFHNETDMLNELNDKILAGENWEFSESPRPLQILWNHLFYTFDRLQFEDESNFEPNKKILVQEVSGKKVAIFNTGHIDKFHRWVYMVFKENDDTSLGAQPFSYVGFCTEGEKLGSNNYLAYFEPLPEPAKYFSEFSELIFDPDLRVDTNAEHILIERRVRIKEWEKEIEQLSEEEALPILYEKLKRAVEQAKKRVKWNYKAAIPQYFPTARKIQFLLPLYERNKVVGALTVEREGKAYSGRTVLTLEQAYNNARLIARPDNDWLTVQSVDLTMGDV